MIERHRFACSNAILQYPTPPTSLKIKSIEIKTSCPTISRRCTRKVSYVRVHTSKKRGGRRKRKRYKILESKQSKKKRKKKAKRRGGEQSSFRRCLDRRRGRAGWKDTKREKEKEKEREILARYSCTEAPSHNSRPLFRG